MKKSQILIAILISGIAAGGIYYAAQSRAARTPEQQGSTSSIALLYLSAWRSEAAAAEFSKLYGRELSKKYSGVVRDPADESSAAEQVYKGSEGPVVIVRQGKQVFVSESFDLTMARKLQFVFFGAQQNGELEQAADAAPPELTAHLARMIAGCGLMKASLRH